MNDGGQVRQDGVIFPLAANSLQPVVGLTMCIVLFYVQDLRVEAEPPVLIIHDFGDAIVETIGHPDPVCARTQAAQYVNCVSHQSQ